ncbi:hypothetical protein RHOSPDRAFT_31654 [Rhodotorula sp. JG-1b]|nr:hypothetical protein RHOSPDRAFT_31654 [Rhodotorula sp. JG-1b]
MSAPATTQQQQQRQKLYRTLHDQIDLALYPQALRTVNKLLARDPADQLALATRAQLVVALDRYPEALQLESADPLTRAYCLYKLARPNEAAEALNELANEQEVDDPEQDRARQVLEAQLSYRLGEYERARDLFDELAATAELDSPELADLEANLAACTAKLDFLVAVPATLANLSGSGSHVVPSVDELEARPLALVLPSSSAASTSATIGGGGRGQTGKTASSPGGTTTATPRARRRPRGKRFAATMAGGTESNLSAVNAAAPPPAEDRWIPKRQRPSMRDALLQAKEKQRGRKRDKVMAAAAATQGSAAAVEEEAATQKSGQKAGGGGGGSKAGSGSGNKKKKGGRK